jgi:DNA-binding beta-propeller fold protein YncE
VVNTSTFTLSNTISLGAGVHPAGIAMSTSGSVLYVSSFSDGNVIQINTSTNTEIPNSNITTNGDKVYTMSISSNGTYLYGASYDTSNVFVINTISGKFVGNITGFDYPFGMAYSPTGNYLYVGNYDDGTVSKLSAVSNPTYVAYAAGTYNVMLETSGNENYSSNTISESFRIYPYNLTLNTTLRHTYTYTGNPIAFNYSLEGVGLKPINTTISLNGKYITSWSTDGLSFLKNLTKVKAYQTGYGDSPYTFSPSGRNVYMTTEYNGILVFNTSTGTFIRNISSDTFDYPSQTAISPSGATIYVLSYYGNLSVVNTSTGNVIKVVYGNTIKDGNLGAFLSLSNNGQYAYIGGGYNLSILNLSSGKLSSVLPNSIHDGFDSGIAVNPLNNYVYVTNYTKLDIINVSNPETPNVIFSPVSFYYIYSNPVVSPNGTVVYVPVYYGHNSYYESDDGNITAVSAYTGNYLGAYVSYYPYGGLTVLKNGKYLFSSSDEEYLLITNLTYPPASATNDFVFLDLKGADGLTVSPSGKYLYAASSNGNTSIYYINSVGEYMLNASAGNYELNFSASSVTDSNNYTHNYTLFSVNVMKATPVLSLTLPQNDVYNGQGKAIRFSISSIYNQTNAQLYINGNEVANTFTSGEYNISAIGNYSVKLATQGDANYTAYNTSANILIRDQPEAELLFPSNTTYTGSNMIVTWGIGTTGNVINATLYMDGNAVATGNTMGLEYIAPADIGNYKFRVVSNLTSEYFGISLNKTLSITAPQNTTTTTIGGVVNSPGGGFGIPGGTQTTTIPVPKNISNATLNENIDLLPFSTELINYSDGELLLYIKSDLNLTTLHTINIHVPKYLALPKAPSGLTLLYAINYSVSGSNKTAENATMKYNCNLSPGSIYPYMLSDNSWIPISNFTIDSAACSISFSVPQDPTVALLYKNSTTTTPTTTLPISNTTHNETTTVSANVTPVTTVSNTTSVPQTEQASSAVYYIVAVIIIIIVAIIAYFVRNGKKR